MTRPADRPARRPRRPRATSSARPSTGWARTAGPRPPPPRAGPSPPRSRTCSGPTRSPSSPRTRTRRRGKPAWDEVVLAAIADPLGYVDAGAHELAALPRDEVLDPLGRGPGRAPRGADRAPRRARRCRGSARRCRRPRWRPRGSWRRGRTRSTCTTRAGERPAADRPDQARRPPRRPHPQLLLLRARGGAAGRGVPGRADRAQRRDLGVGARGRRASRVTGLGVRLLPAGHPAGPPRRHRPGRGRRGRRALAADRPGVRGPAGAGREATR